MHSATGLRAWNTGRYGTLDLTDGGTITDDTLSYDVFTHGEALRRSRGADPLGPLRARRVLATGHSQSAGRLRTYYNSVHPLAGVFDGFVLHGIFGDTTVRTDIRTPVSKLQIGDRRARVLRADDAPARHALGAYVGGGRDHARRLEARDRARDTAHPRYRLAARGLPAQRADAVRRADLLARAVLRGCRTWRTTGSTGAPVKGSSLERPPLQLAATTPPTAVRDADGNALGGIRLPRFAVPVATDSGSNTGPGFCFLHGVHLPQSAERLAQLYRGEAN